MVNLSQSLMNKKTISLLISFNSIQTISDETIRYFVNTNVYDLSKLRNTYARNVIQLASKHLHFPDLYSTYPLIVLTKVDFPDPISPVSAILNVNPFMSKNSSSLANSSRSSSFSSTCKPRRCLNMTKTEIYDCLKELKSHMR